MGLPEWAVPTRGKSAALWFQIEGVAEATATATSDELRGMVQSMLSDRFKLTVHRETRDGPGYSLFLAKGGTELKETSDSEELPVLDVINGRMVLRGKSTLDKVADWMTSNPAIIGTTGPVINKTGLPQRYIYQIFLNDGPSAGRGSRGSSDSPQTPEEASRQAVEALSARLESQVGLRIQFEKSLPVQMIVIDHVEKPSPN
jgi:uncharacterized protein (TIGR03435 family)